MGMPKQVDPDDENALDSTIYVRVPSAWKRRIDNGAKQTGIKQAVMLRMVIKAGMVHLGITEPEEDEDPGVPPETVARVLHLRRHQD